MPDGAYHMSEVNLGLRELILGLNAHLISVGLFPGLGPFGVGDPALRSCPSHSKILCASLQVHEANIWIWCFLLL